MTDTIVHDAPASVRSFTDLRRFARDPAAGLRAPAVASADAFIAARRRLFDSDGAEVGAIDLHAGRGRVDGLGADEFVIVCDGALTLAHTRGMLALHEGASAVLPRGLAFDWHAEEPVRLVFMRHPGREAAAGAPVRIDETASLSPSGAPLAELLIGPTPSCRNHTDFTSADGELLCGTWDSTPYRRRAMAYRHSELMHLLDGAVTLKDETGARHTFVRGDIFVVQHGARCSWDSAVLVKKVYAIARPA